MKSTFLKAIKVVAFSLVLSLGASGAIFANGAGVSTTKVALNGGGNGAGGTVKRKTKANKRIAKRVAKRKNQRTA